MQKRNYKLFAALIVCVALAVNVAAQISVPSGATNFVDFSVRTGSGPAQKTYKLGIELHGKGKENEVENFLRLCDGENDKELSFKNSVLFAKNDGAAKFLEGGEVYTAETVALEYPFKDQNLGESIFDDAKGGLMEVATDIEFVMAYSVSMDKHVNNGKAFAGSKFRLVHRVAIPKLNHMSSVIGYVGRSSQRNAAILLGLPNNTPMKITGCKIV